MTPIELEDKVKRRDYKLPCIWGCLTCENAGDPLSYFVTIYNDGVITQRCMKGHEHNVHRRCTRCNTNYPIHIDVCFPCESRIEEILIREKLIEGVDESIEEIKYGMRKKQITKERGEHDINEWIQKRLILKAELDEIIQDKKGEAIRLVGVLRPESARTAKVLEN